MGLFSDIPPVSAPLAADTSLRTAGRTSPQRPVRLPSRDHDHPTKSKSMPTIPSRFEVTLFKGDRERLGFGSKVLKFATEMPEDGPGPGEYGHKKTFHEDFSERTSWGIRGTGSFASKSVRFGARSTPSMPKAGRGVPGPGAYSSEAAVQLRQPRDFNQASHSAAFAKKGDENSRAVSSTSLVPGPGYYHKNEAKALAKDASAAQSAFRSLSQRGGGVPVNTEDVPGPGMYSSGKGSMQAAAAPEGPGAEFSTTANFKDPLRRRIARVHRDLPAADERARDALGDFADKVGRECLGTLGTAAKLPGPGHYDQDRDSSWEARPVTDSRWPSSCFAAGPHRHDWAAEDAALVPGPGRYDPHKVVPERVTPATSAFNSISERNKLQHPSAPGPAYYSPEMLGARKSFWLNRTKQWAS